MTFLDFNLELQKRKKNREILLNCEKVESVASNGSEAAWEEFTYDYNWRERTKEVAFIDKYYVVVFVSVLHHIHKPKLKQTHQKF